MRVQCIQNVSNDYNAFLVDTALNSLLTNIVY